MWDTHVQLAVAAEEGLGVLGIGVLWDTLYEKWYSPRPLALTEWNTSQDVCAERPMRDLIATNTSDAASPSGFLFMLRARSLGICRDRRCALHCDCLWSRRLHIFHSHLQHTVVACGAHSVHVCVLG